MRKNKFNIISVISIVLTLTVLVACGGGGGSVAGGGIGGSGVVASGSITAKGSIFVNGVEYETTLADVTLNGTSQPDDSGLLRGMVVRVDGTRDTETTGTANTVIYEDVVKGPVTNIVTSTQTTTLTVLGQTVIVEQDVTYVDDNAGGTTLTLPTFNINDEVEVSGLRETIVGGVAISNGPIRATYIDIKETLLSEYKVNGVVENATANNFDIAGLQVSFSGTVPPDGTVVEVKGMASSFSTPPDALVATSVEARTTGLGETEVDHAEVEGFIADLDTLDETFTLDGQTIDYSGASFEGGLAGDLNDGSKVEAEGSITGGILVADKIEFKESIRFEGNAFNVDSPVSSALEIEGLNGIGLVIYIDSSLTEIEDVNGDPGTIASIADGYDIKVRGREIASGIVATEIEVISTTSSNKIKLQGPSTTILEPTVEILGKVTVDTSIGAFSFFDVNDTPLLNSSEFFALLELGDIVEVSGDLTLPSIWDEIDLEDE